MRIVIVGDGKVGYALTEQLSREGHDVFVIDSNPKVLQNSMETLDVMVLEGNGVSLNVQIEAGVPESDILIAGRNQSAVLHYSQKAWMQVYHSKSEKS